MSSPSRDTPDQTFLNADRLLVGGPRAFARNVERLLWHLGFDDIRNIDGSGDEGGDILAARDGFRWVFQCKWTSGNTISEQAVVQVDAAKAFYGADRAVVVTNARPGRAAVTRRNRLKSIGVSIDIWGDEALQKFATTVLSEYAPKGYNPYPYQQAAIDAAVHELAATGSALVILATGLGKTVVAGHVISRHLRKSPLDDVLVVAHVKELVHQLERAMWRHVSKSVPTQVLTGDERPRSLRGLTCATIASALAAVDSGWRPSMVVVDEAHHVGASGQFQRLLDALGTTPTLALTATPWRGDEYDIAIRFGLPVFRMGIAEGMASGYLAQVNYRLFTDGLDWDAVAEASEKGLSIKDLNHRLFLPHRDEAIIENLRETWRCTVHPRAIVFCRTIDHAEEVAQLLRASGWRRARCLNTRQSKRDRDVLMSEFRDGRIPIVTTVDIFNEGVDVPDVNILCFMRVTHSRRIFVQQLGRGLRLSAHKERVEVLDFVSDIRRVAATIDLQRSLERLQDDEIERLQLPQPVITFSEPEVGSLLQEWIKDAAALEDAAEEVRLQFPEVPYP